MSAYHEREVADERNLDDLLSWLAYGKDSGYTAARCSVKQEMHWATLLQQQIETIKFLKQEMQVLLDAKFHQRGARFVADFVLRTLKKLPE